MVVVVVVSAAGDLAGVSSRTSGQGETRLGHGCPSIPVVVGGGGGGGGGDLDAVGEGQRQQDFFLFSGFFDSHASGGCV